MPHESRYVRCPLAEIVERAGPFVVAGDQGAEPGSSCLEEALVKRVDARSGEVSAPDVSVNIAQARHRAVGLSQPRGFDAADRGEQVTGYRVFRFNEHRQHHPCGALISCDLT